MSDLKTNTRMLKLIMFYFRLLTLVATNLTSSFTLIKCYLGLPEARWIKSRHIIFVKKMIYFFICPVIFLLQNIKKQLEFPLRISSCNRNNSNFLWCFRSKTILSRCKIKFLNRLKKLYRPMTKLHVIVTKK